MHLCDDRWPAHSCDMPLRALLQGSAVAQRMLAAAWMPLVRCVA